MSGHKRGNELVWLIHWFFIQEQGSTHSFPKKYIVIARKQQPQTHTHQLTIILGASPVGALSDT